MKNLLFSIAILLVMLFAPVSAYCQTDMNRVVAISYLHIKWPEKGSMTARDSLIAIYNSMVVNKNEYILSHREYRHFYTADSRDYMVIDEYKDLPSMEKANEMTTELEKKAWPDEAKRKAFMDAMGAYFENWHGDAIYSTNPKLSKN